MGWSRDGGDLRVPHFFATHAMHSCRRSGCVDAAARPGAALAGGGVRRALRGFTVLVFLQALAGRPFAAF